MRMLITIVSRRALAAFVSATLSTQPLFAELDRAARADETMRVGAGGAEGERGVEMRPELGHGRPEAGGMTTPVLRAAMNVAKETGLLPVTNKVNNADGSISFNSKETGNTLMTISPAAGGGADVTVHKNSEGVQPTIGVVSAGTTQTKVDMSEGSLTLHVTPESAKFKLAASMTVDRGTASSNVAALTSLSPGAPATAGNALAMHPDASAFVLTPASFNHQNVVNYAVAGGPAAAGALADGGARPDRGFAVPPAGDADAAPAPMTAVLNLTNAGMHRVDAALVAEHPVLARVAATPEGATAVAHLMSPTGGGAMSVPEVAALLAKPEVAANIVNMAQTPAGGTVVSILESGASGAKLSPTQISKAFTNLTALGMSPTAAVVVMMDPLVAKGAQTPQGAVQMDHLARAGASPSLIAQLAQPANAGLVKFASTLEGAVALVQVSKSDVPLSQVKTAISNLRGQEVSHGFLVEMVNSPDIVRAAQTPAGAKELAHNYRYVASNMSDVVARARTMLATPVVPDADSLVKDFKTASH